MRSIRFLFLITALGACAPSNPTSPPRGSGPGTPSGSDGGASPDLAQPASADMAQQNPPDMAQQNLPDMAQQNPPDMGSLVPPGCIPVTIGTLVNGTQITPPGYYQQPTPRGPFSVPLGDTALADRVRIRFDAATPVGTHAIQTPVDGNCFQRGEQCVWAAVDFEPGVGFTTMFAAVAGEIELLERKTDQQTRGTIRHIELREVTVDESIPLPWYPATLVPNGACYWIETGDWNTIRAEGCDPWGANTCAVDKTCVVQNASGSDGDCKLFGTKLDGEECTLTVDGDSDCAAGYKCANIFDDTAPKTCFKQCDILSATTGCPAGTTCYMYGLCMDLGPFDPAPVHTSCTTEWAECGVDGARGTCSQVYDTQGNPAPIGLMCMAYARAQTACPAGEELGYISTDFADISLGVCQQIVAP